MNVKPEHDDGLLTPFTVEERIAYLIRKHLFEDISDNEQKELDVWLSQSIEHPLIFKDATNENNLRENLRFVEEADVSQKLERIKEKLTFNKPRRVIPLWYYRAAAAVLVIAGFSTYFFLHNNHSTKNPLATQDILPGSRKAILTLANDSIVRLDHVGDSMLALQDKIVIKKENGQVDYIKQGGVAFNTISTLRGNTYSLVLSDGTKIWLNAASSIKFPTTFTGKQRKVSITGEAYFEVAKNPDAPFIVDIANKNTSVEVLGTHFNINAYPEEATTKVTLLEGAVKVINNEHNVAMLKPSQEANISKTGKTSVTEKVDTATTTAWKNDLTQFNKVELDVLMRQISRWYDIEVVFEGSMPKMSFNGSIKRNINLSEVIEILKMNNISSRIEGRTLIIRKKPS